MDKDILKNVKNDKFAQLLGIEILEASPGYALVEMKIEDKHKNGINIVQGRCNIYARRLCVCNSL